MGFLKTTAVGGLLFLVPIVTLGILLAKAFRTIRGVIVAADIDGLELTAGKILTLNVIAGSALFAFCFLAGLFAGSRMGRRMGDRIEEFVLTRVPGYTFVRGITEGWKANEQRSRSLAPVLVRYDDNATLAFQVSGEGEGMVTVYTPGCPNPWSGAINYVEPDRVERLEMSTGEALKIFRSLGSGAPSVDARSVN